MNLVQCCLRATGGFWLLRLPYFCLTLVCFGLVSGLNAASFTASPASGQQGAHIRLSAERLSPSVSYNLQYFDTAATTIASVSSDAAGKLSTSIVLPSLPAGTGVLRLMRSLQVLPAASVQFTALATLTATFPTPVQAGQKIAFEVNGLRPGSLTIDYDGELMFGPVTVSASRYRGKISIPRDRPVLLPANVSVVVRNRVGIREVNSLSVTLAVRPAAIRPFTIVPTQSPPSALRPNSSFQIGGNFTLEPNEAVPTQVSSWFFSDTGAVFPLASTGVSLTGAQATYSSPMRAPTLYGLSAGGFSPGRIGVVANGSDTFGAAATNRFETPASPLPPNTWRFKVRVRNQNNQAVEGAIVLFEDAPIVDTTSAPAGTSASGLMSVGQASQLVDGSINGSQIPATDALGCPLALDRKLTNALGDVEFLLDDQRLRLVQNSYNPNDYDARAGLGLGINASAQGYGDVGANGFTPRRYIVTFNGAGGQPVGPDHIVVNNLDGSLVLDMDGREATLFLFLPVIEPRVALYDTSMVPTLGYKTVSNTLLFGPTHNRVLFPSGVPVTSPTNDGYPTRMAVRTDPAVSGDISRAELYLDVNRNGSLVMVNFIRTPAQPLDCSLEGLSSSLTWYADLPNPNFATQAQGKITGFVFFKGQKAAGAAGQPIAFEIKQRDLRWLNDTDGSGAPLYTNRQITMSEGGQSLHVNAEREALDAKIQLPSAPPPEYEIGLLKSETDQTEVLSIGYNASQDAAVSTQHQLLGENRTAGRSSNATLAETNLGAPYHHKLPLLDKSFPLFYYVWGVPVLLGVEFGADFAIFAEIDIDFRILEQLRTRLITTPELRAGLDFYMDLDVLFDLLDGGVDLYAGFDLSMPVIVENGQVQTPTPTFDPRLVFSWHFEFFCLPFDVICDALNDINGSKTLLPQDNHGSAPPRPPLFPIRRQQAIAYSPNGGDGLMLQTSVPSGTSTAKLMAYQVDGADFGRTGQVLSNAPGIRSVALTYITEFNALAVWAESSESYANLSLLSPANRVARQRLMFAQWDGEDWTQKQVVPAGPGNSFGVGGVSLAVCSSVTCAPRGEILAVWTRGTRALQQRNTQVFSARFNSGVWSTPASVDSAGLMDSSPSAAYVGADPYVAFVRNTSGNFDNTDARKIAYRNLRVGGVQIPANLPSAVAWPRIVALPAGGFAIAHTHANDPRAFVGNTQRIALAYGSNCTNGVCSIAAQVLTDSQGRPIYGERPTPMVDTNGNVTVVMRGVGFGANFAGLQQLPDDPIGMVLHTGELIQMTVARGQNVAIVESISGDGAGHVAPAAAFDSELGHIVVVSQRMPGVPTKMRNQLKAAGFNGGTARGAEQSRSLEARAQSGDSCLACRASRDSDDVAIFTSERGLDLMVESVQVANNTWIGGNSAIARVLVRNAGTTYDDPLRPWKLRLSLDAPYKSSSKRLGSLDVALLASGQSASTSFTFTWPADVKPDQRRTLFAELYRAIGNDDVNDSNNIGTLERGGMPQVYGLGGAALDRSNFIALAWELPVAANANLIAGYRIWSHDGDGNFQHLGSSYKTGFLDLSAKPGVLRTYRVTSYSANAIESEPSASVAIKGFLAEPIFRNGFE